MKKILIIITVVFFHLQAKGQVMENDSAIASQHKNPFIIRCFVNLTPNPKLDSLEKVYKFRFCSLAACINPLTTEYLERQALEAIKIRLEEIAERFVKEGTPVLVFIGGDSSYKYAERMNEGKNAYNIQYVSFGDYCNLYKNDKFLETMFNDKTKQLLGIKEPDTNTKHKLQARYARRDFPKQWAQDILVGVQPHVHIGRPLLDQ